RIGHLRDQYRPVAKAADVSGVADDTGFSCRNRLSYRGAADERLASPLQPECPENSFPPRRLHRLWARLHHVEFAGLAVLGPLHVHRASVMRLHADGPASEKENLIVGKH